MSKRTRALPRTAFVYDFETDAVGDIPPPDQPPIQLAYSILDLNSGDLEELDHCSLFISDQTDAIGPYHAGRFTIEQVREHGHPMRDVAACVVEAIRGHNVAVLAAHNGSGMDFPHLRRLVGALPDDPEALQLLDALGEVDTMLDTAGCTAFLPAAPTKSVIAKGKSAARERNDPYPRELTILHATLVDGQPLLLRVRYEDPHHTLVDIAGASKCGKWALRFHFDDANEVTRVAGMLLNYDARSNRKLFTFKVCADDSRGPEYTIQLYTDWHREKPLIALEDDEQSFENVSASPVCGYTLKNPKQDALLARYDIENANAHDAGADVRALCELLRRGPWDNRTLKYALPSAVTDVYDDAVPGTRVQFEYGRDGELTVVSGVFLGPVVFSHKSWGVRVRVGPGVGGVRCYSSTKLRRFEALGGEGTPATVQGPAASGRGGGKRKVCAL